MTALSPATIFSIDIYKALYRPDATEQQVTKVTRITIVLLAVTAIAVASFLPPILAAMTWLFAWLIPVFFIILYAMFWQRSDQAALVTLVVVWLLNFVWSFTDVASQLGLLSNNAIMAALVSLFVGGLSNLFFSGQPAYFDAAAQPAKSM